MFLPLTGGDTFFDETARSCFSGSGLVLAGLLREAPGPAVAFPVAAYVDFGLRSAPLVLVLRGGAVAEASFFLSLKGRADADGESVFVPPFCNRLEAVTDKVGFFPVPVCPCKVTLFLTIGDTAAGGAFAFCCEAEGVELFGAL